MAEYIEREALLRYLNDIWLTATPTDFTPDDDRQLAIVRCMGLNDAMDAVKDYPAGDVVPVRHGRWIWDDEGYHCSECWHHAYGNTGEVMSGEYKYCPFCGAVMEQDGDGDG